MGEIWLDYTLKITLAAVWDEPQATRGKTVIIKNIQTKADVLHNRVSGEGQFKWLDPKYKTLFVYKYTFVCKVLYKQ